MTPPVQSQGEDRVALSDGAMVYFRQRGAHAAVETDSVMVGVGSMGKKAGAMRWNTDKQFHSPFPRCGLRIQVEAYRNDIMKEIQVKQAALEGSMADIALQLQISQVMLFHCHQSFPISSVHMKPQPVTQSNTSQLRLADSPGHDAAEGLCTDAAGKGE